MSAGSLPLGVITVMLFTCLFAQGKALITNDLGSEAERSFAAGTSGKADADAPASPAPPNPAVEDRWKDPSASQITIYPVFAWAPVFGISTRELPSSPGGGGAAVATFCLQVAPPVLSTERRSLVSESRRASGPPTARSCGRACPASATVTHSRGSA
jgi:hypothetical protein